MNKRIFDNDEWLDPKKFYLRYGFSTSHQAALRSDGKISFYRIGRYIRYRKSEIDTWIVSHKV